MADHSEQIEKWGVRWIDSDVYFKSSLDNKAAVAFLGDASEHTEVDYYLRQVQDRDITCLGERPGFRGPTANEIVGYVQFYTPWSGPSRWFATAATKLFPNVRLRMRRFDTTNMPCEYPEYWSSDGTDRWNQGDNWSAWIMVPKEVHEAADPELDCFDYDPEEDYLEQLVASQEHLLSGPTQPRSIWTGISRSVTAPPAA